MEETLLSVEQVAERLGLHVRTVRNYVRDGKLPAVRIGKQYRIAHTDLDAFTGRAVPAPPRETVRRQRHTDVSSIVDIDAVSPETAHRLTTVLTAAAGTRDAGPPLRIDTVYDEERGRMKVVVLGGLADTARLLDYIEGILAS
ncbi:MULTISPECIES: helix-turn-helix domain-containing protein [unclassified Rhodococcus (in: high G+C Gram-positive bacteria)]|uniref:helix-turn-helix domain-containing protein n=1 Tax=unclassified Rhodococcus (in: high G+C Gram-positive bacteria) TaxID=192944 RepID=UPI00146F7EDD|nr:MULTISPECIES: helix-turn-helix domain-containing protein [unclassified Rhodococcus (in: high G+C Gram-positive bacteria)]MBF0662571.1 helix-turn-helix domain-containing protein [Rhodococcus sp. (in: high G+C Gram-positive bacteria)]NME79348.1 helix-turn-helix domain-containing protein [Rhodococcus sp. 105337]